MKFTGTAFCKGCKRSLPDSEFTVRGNTRIFLCTSCRPSEREKFVLSRDLAKARDAEAFRKCKRCGEVRPNTTKFFMTVGNGKGPTPTRTGNLCKACFSAAIKAMHDRRRLEDEQYQRFKRGETSVDPRVEAAREAGKVTGADEARVARLKADVRTYAAALAQAQSELAKLLQDKPDTPPH